MRKGQVRPINQNLSTDALLVHQSTLTPEPPRFHVRLLKPPVALENYEGEATTLAEVAQSPLVRTAHLPFLCKSKRLHFSLMCSAILLSFLLDDFRHLLMPPSSDWIIDCLLAVLFFYFCVNLYIEVRANDRYFGSFFFWMDVGATLGIIGDMQTLMWKLTSPCEIYYEYRWKTVLRIARLGSSSIRLIRHLRLMKIENIGRQGEDRESQSRAKKRTERRSISNAIKCIKGESEDRFHFEYRHSGQFEFESVSMSPSNPPKTGLKKMNTLHRIVRGNTGDFLPQRAAFPQQSLTESEISKKLTFRLVKNLVVVSILVTIVSWVLLIPVLNDGPRKEGYGVRMIEMAKGLNRFEEVVWEFISRNVGEGGLSTLEKLTVGEVVMWRGEGDAVRESDTCTVEAGSVKAIFSITPMTRIFSIFSICSSLFVSLLLIAVILQLSTDIRHMVLFPLERMIETVRYLASNPMVLAQSQGNNYSQSYRKTRKWWEGARDYAEEEIALLENAFLKIGIMLGLVYGSAGRQIITDSMLVSGGEISPLLPGREIVAVFCFAKIANFELLLDYLGPKIFRYVNLISSLVHHKAEQFFGSVNKNLGDSYLLVWKFPAEDEMIVHHKLVLNPSSAGVKATASLALLFAIKSITKTARSQDLFRYQRMKQFSGKGMAFTRKLTFGFHAGWAYEGPIGSVYKIDASYLSPNVNLASRIESATHHYGVDILLSEEMFVRLDDSVKPYLRHIDTVQLKGVHDCVKLFSFDLSDTGLVLSQSKPDKSKTQRKRTILKDALDNGMITVNDLFVRSETVSLVRRHYGKRFFDSYEEARRLYSAGQWKDAGQILFSVCLNLVPFDGPSKSLISFMGRWKYEAPLTWSGVRELSSK